MRTIGQFLFWAGCALSIAGCSAKAGEATTTAVLEAGELRVTLTATGTGLTVTGLEDVKLHRNLLAAHPLPLMEITLQHVASRATLTVDSDHGWGEVVIEKTPRGARISWRKCQAPMLKDLTVVAEATTDANISTVLWNLRVDNPLPDWSLMQVAFPQVSLAELGNEENVFFPNGAGVVKGGPWWGGGFDFSGLYPNAHAAMQYMAAYGSGTGLYLAMHDPHAAVKRMSAAKRQGEYIADFAFAHPCANMGVAGNGFTMSGQAVWRIFRGDWYDAAMIYRDWVTREAGWYPTMGPDGRTDTPMWLRENCFWVTAGGEANVVVPAVMKAREALGVPIAFHWYTWHRYGFDTGYPYYWPARPGLADGATRLRQAGVYAVPYVNGRLWDSTARNDPNSDFIRVGLAGTAKDQDGRFYIEQYPTRVQFAVMCPATQLWQTYLGDVALRLMNEYKTPGVYLDQVSATVPQLCMDKSHGHPLGGGTWWVDGYAKLLSRIRAGMPKDSALFTECNAEPYMRGSDGYLVFHWQSEGQVPAFPAVYAGAVVMFGRAQGGDMPARRAKAAQELVYGEQIGWMGPDSFRDESFAGFLRQVVRLRWQLRRYFYAGRMLRPPRLGGRIPTVRADWQWRNNNEAIFAGAWMQAEGKAAIILVNVSDEPVTASLAWDASAAGIDTSKVNVTTVTPDGPGETVASAAKINRTVTVPAQSALAYEITPERAAATQPATKP